MPGSKNAPEGWFSRRHPTRKEHDVAVADYADRRVGRPKQTWLNGKSVKAA